MSALRRPVMITPGLRQRRKPAWWHRLNRDHGRDRRLEIRAVTVTFSVMAVCLAIASQLVHLAMAGRASITTTVSNPIATSFSRPDIVDRHGRLLATDVRMPSLFADPSLILDRNEVVEQLSSFLPDLDRAKLRASLADRNKRFVWVRRGLAPAVAQQIHDLGLPGLAFKQELRRAYPSGRLAGHALGSVNIDNKGLAGIERYIDREIGVDPVLGAVHSRKAPVQLSLDMGVQHALEDELQQAMRRYSAKGAAGLVLDVNSGEVLASASLPDVDPMDPTQLQQPQRRDKIAGGTYELGSIFKAFTVAMALEANLVSLNSRLDVSKPLIDGRHTIRDAHASGRALTVAEIFTHSSNVGAGMLALAAGPKRQKMFLDNFHLLDQIKTELGPVAAPQLPQRWQRIEQITIAFGHGMAVAPLQFAASASALINGGSYITPTYLRRPEGQAVPRQRVLSAATSKKMQALMRLNVTDPHGTGSRADVPGYGVGGKTGTAEVAGVGGYKNKTVISSFLAAFPMDQPRYLVLVSIFEPTGNSSSGGSITASRNAAPTTGRLIRRIAPLLNVVPSGRFAALN